MTSSASVETLDVVEGELSAGGDKRPLAFREMDRVAAQHDLQRIRARDIRECVVRLRHLVKLEAVNSA
jgi:hypothetical protein